MGQTKNLALEHFGVPLDKQHCQVRGILNFSDNEQLRFCAFFSLTMVLISTVTFIVSTIDELQTDEHGMVEFPLLLNIIGIIDHFSIGFFTIEYLMRVTCSPRKLKFIGAPMNMIDLFAIIPFYLSLLLEGIAATSPVCNLGIAMLQVWRTLR